MADCDSPYPTRYLRTKRPVYDHDVNISLSLAHIERNDAKRELVRVSRF